MSLDKLGFIQEFLESLDEGIDPSKLYIRLDPVSRDPNNSMDGIAMRVADPLWMLGRQWQFGEFIGEDNGSPMNIRVKSYQTEVNYFLKEGASLNHPFINREFDPPLEVRVEAMKYPLYKNWKARAKWGKKIETLIDDKRHLEVLREEYGIQPPIDLGNIDSKTLSFIKWMEGKCLDAHKIFEIYGDSTSLLYEGLSGEKGIRLMSVLSGMAREFYRRYSQKTNKEDFWEAERLEYTFQIGSNPKKSNEPGVTLTAPDYRSGKLDWYSFDHAKVVHSPKLSWSENTYWPILLSSANLPRKRLFELEDAKMDLSKMLIDTSEMGKLFLIEYALTYGNDWFVVPYKMQAGSLAWVEELEVMDVFGVKTKIKNGEEGKGPILDEDGRRVWDVFKIRKHNPASYDIKDHFLYLPPVLHNKQESQALEEIIFKRDEASNLIWAIENRLMNGLGQSVDGRSYHEAFLSDESRDTSPSDEDSDAAKLNYSFSNADEVLTNWIPFQPRILKNTQHEVVQLRSRLDRLNSESNTYRSLLLQETRYLREESIPQAGLIVQLTLQRARTADGETYVWLGRKVKSGSGPGNSGLEFDVV